MTNAEAVVAGVVADAVLRSDPFDAEDALDVVTLGLAEDVLVTLVTAPDVRVDIRTAIAKAMLKQGFSADTITAAVLNALYSIEVA